MSYAVAFERSFQPAAEWYFNFLVFLVFALCERKNEKQSESTMLPQAISLARVIVAQVI